MAARFLTAIACLLDLARKDARESVRLYVLAKDRWGEAQGYNTLGLISIARWRSAPILTHR
jgi:hypothetical protein